MMMPFNMQMLRTALGSPRIGNNAGRTVAARWMALD